jgi:transcriptional regulator of NAD metabolism
VINFDELNNQPELKNLLEEGYTVAARTNDYILYDLRQPLSR